MPLAVRCSYLYDFNKYYEVALALYMYSDDDDGNTNLYKHFNNFMANISADENVFTWSGSNIETHYLFIHKVLYHAHMVLKKPRLEVSTPAHK